MKSCLLNHAGVFLHIGLLVILPASGDQLIERVDWIV